MKTCECNDGQRDVECVDRDDGVSMMYINGSRHIIKEKIEDCIIKQFRDGYSNKKGKNFCLGTA
jgi:hypothetical protein